MHVSYFLYHLSGLIIHIAMASFGSTNALLSGAKKDPLSHITSIWAAASILPDPGTLVTPIIT